LKIYGYTISVEYISFYESVLIKDAAKSAFPGNSFLIKFKLLINYIEFSIAHRFYRDFDNNILIKKELDYENNINFLLME
jgi:hypothetical protein